MRSWPLLRNVKHVFKVSKPRKNSGKNSLKIAKIPDVAQLHTRMLRDVIRARELVLRLRRSRSMSMELREWVRENSAKIAKSDETVQSWCPESVSASCRRFVCSDPHGALSSSTYCISAFYSGLEGDLPPRYINLEHIYQIRMDLLPHIGT